MSLYLIPTTLSENTQALSAEAVDAARKIDEFIVENEKSARHFLKSIQTPISQNHLIFHLLNEHSTAGEISSLSEVLKKNKDIGLLSEAGCPGVADPGAAVVAMAHQQGIKVVPLTGPSSILLALMASGLNGQSFVFHGYLPRESADRKKKLLQLEKEAISKKQSQIFIETPYRNQQMLNDILQTCSPSIKLCIACMLTSKDEMVKTKSVGEWKKQPPDINKKPTVFIVGY
jgi:16S rRNA (cytidine1402-2'-O)-methyltransferase